MEKTRKFWLWFDLIGCLTSSFFYIRFPSHDGLFLFSAAMYGLGYILWYLFPAQKDDGKLP